MTETDKKAEQSTGAETEGPKPDAEHQRKINVANLPWDVTEQQLRDLFSGHEVEKVEIYHYRKYTLALVLFKDKDTAAAALADKENAMFRDRRLRMHMEFTTIRHIKREVVVTVIEDENMTEEQLWDKVKAAGVEPTSVLIFHPLGYVTLEKECDKPALLEKLKTAGFNVHDVNQRDQNQHLDIWRAAKLFFRNRNRVQLLNIPNKWIEDKEEMKKQCAEGGTITEAVSNNVTQNPVVASNYARIFYETEEQAAKAAKALNGRVVEGKRIHALHLGSALMPNYKTSVYVTALDRGVTEEQVYDHFKQFGEIEFTNRRNCGDAAIICFKNAASAEKALACTTFPAPTEENKDATKEVAVKKYDGPLVLRPVALKRKLKPGEEEKDQAEKTKEQQSVLNKLKAYHPIYVGNVPLNCPPLELKHYFAQHGPIKFMFSPQILSYRNSAPHPVKTFIIYYMNRVSQQNAVRFFDHKFFGGHRLHVLPLRGTQNMDVKKTIKMTKIPFMSEDALFKKIKPFVGKINRIVKKARLAAYIELEDTADVDKMMNTETADHPLPKGKMEQLKTPISTRVYNEDDVRVLNGIAKIVAKNPDMLKKTPLPPPNKRPRMDFGGPGFDQGPGGFNPNMNNPNAIQDLLRLAFMSGKNVGENLASNQSSFGPDPPVANSNNFGDSGFGNRNRNNQGGNQGNFRGQGRMNQNQNRGNNAGNFGGNNNAGGNNFQGSPGNQNRGGQNMNRGNQQNQNRGGNMNQGNNMNQSGGNVNRPQQNKPMNMNTGNQNQNRNNQVGGGNMNRNQNNRNFDNDNSFGGGNNFGNNRNNNFSNDSFGNDDNNFGNNSSNNFSSDNFGGNTNRNFGGNKRNQNDNFNSFGSGNNSGSSGGNNRFNNDGNNFSSNFNNRNNQNNRFDNDDNNFSGNTGGNKGGNFGNRQNKPFNQGGNQGGGMSFGEFNNSNNSNRGGNFGGNNSGFNSGNAGGNKWNNNSQQSNTGSRLAGSIFSRRF